MADNLGCKDSKISKEGVDHLNCISALYLYTGTPPHGYGTQAPKVAETVIRACEFNEKDHNMSQKIFGREIERMRWKTSDGQFPYNEIYGNYVPFEIRLMVEKFLEKNVTFIDQIADEVIKKSMHINVDLLIKGRQTFCPFTYQSVTAAIAYQRIYEFLSNNSGKQCVSCLEWLQTYFSLFEKKTIRYLCNIPTVVKKKNYFRETKQYVNVAKTINKIGYKNTETNEETRTVLLTISTRFASYLKHKERGKKDRTAIASANMILRMFLHIIEELHLELAKHIEGATISMGGDEKKAKISNNLSNASLQFGPATHKCQGTEDATKWKECLAPSLFALIHNFFFDPHIRRRLDVKQPSKFGELFSKISVAGNFLMAMKEIQIGKGLKVYSEKGYG